MWCVAVDDGFGSVLEAEPVDVADVAVGPMVTVVDGLLVTVADGLLVIVGATDVEEGAIVSVIVRVGPGLGVMRT